jgi:hypothetical protein
MKESFFPRKDTIKSIKRKSNGFFEKSNVIFCFLNFEGLEKPQNENIISSDQFKNKPNHKWFFEKIV